MTFLKAWLIIIGVCFGGAGAIALFVLLIMASPILAAVLSFLATTAVCAWIVSQ